MKSTSSKKTETLTVCMAIGMVAGGVLSASAQGRQDRDADRSVDSRQEQTGREQQQEPGQRQDMQADGQRRGMQQRDSRREAHAMVRASKLLDMNVQGQGGEKLGDVDEIIMSENRGSVEHITITLEDGEILRLSLDELSAKPGDDDVLLVQASTRELLQRQAEVRDQAWGDREQDVHESRQISKFIGMDVQGTDGKDVGSINDLIIHIESGRIETAAIQTGGFLGIGSRLASVEWQQLNVAADGETASINMTKDQLSERAHRKAVYWDRHAFGRGEGQREHVEQQSGQRQRTSGTKQPRDQDALVGQRERTADMEDRQQMGRQQPDQRTAGVDQPGAEDQIQGQQDDRQRRLEKAEAKQVDNSGRNVRDRDGATLTSFDQGNSKADVDTTARIRKEVNAAENMSVSGKNVKIITRDGQVTLRGPVASVEEKQLIGEIANRIARAGNVDNQLEVKSAGTASSY